MKSKLQQEMIGMGCLGILILGSAMFAPAPASAATNVNYVSWTHNYEGDVLPAAATPAWTTTASGGSQGTDGDILTMNSSGGLAQNVYSVITGPGANWDGSQPSTVEFRMRSISTAPGTDFTSMINLGDGSRIYTFRLGTSEVDVATGATSTYALDVTQFHLFRVTLTNSTAYLYIDNGLSPALTNFGSGIALNRILIGDPSGTDTSGVSEWDFVRWTNLGALAPIAIPEPGSGILLLAGALVAWLRRRKLR